MGLSRRAESKPRMQNATTLFYMGPSTERMEPCVDLEEMIDALPAAPVMFDDWQISQLSTELPRMTTPELLLHDERLGVQSPVGKAARSKLDLAIEFERGSPTAISDMLALTRCAKPTALRLATERSDVAVTPPAAASTETQQEHTTQQQLHNRKERNRASAMESRKRKRQQVEDLEALVLELKATVHTLTAQNAALRRDCFARAATIGAPDVDDEKELDF